MDTRHGIVWPTLLAGLILAVVATHAWAAEKKPAADIVAKVNGKAISREDFKRMEKNIRQQHLRSGKNLVDADIKKEALQSLIRGELLFQESEKKGIQVEESTLNEQISKLKKRYPTEKAFQTALAKMKLTEADVKAQIRREMAITKFVNKEIATKITVSDEEIKAHFEKVKEKIRNYLKQEKLRKEVSKEIERLRGKAKVEEFLGGPTK